MHEARGFGPAWDIYLESVSERKGQKNEGKNANKEMEMLSSLIKLGFDLSVIRIACG